MAGFAEFERDLLRERVRSGVQAAQARGVIFGRRPGQRIKSDKLALKVLALVDGGQSYRQIGRQLDLSKNTVLAIVKRHRKKQKTRGRNKYAYIPDTQDYRVGSPLLLDGSILVAHIFHRCLYSPTLTLASSREDPVNTALS